MKIFHMAWIILCSLLMLACSSKSNENKVIIDDWEAIKKNGELTIVTLNTSASYFIYKDEPMGFDFDMAHDFCELHDLKMNVIIAENVNMLIGYLERGEANLIAYDLPFLIENKDSVTYCRLNHVTRQVLIQRANGGDTILTKQTELIGKDIYVKYGTKFHQRLTNLNDELGGGIHIHNVEKDTINSEELIAMVANNEIRYTIADEDIAKLNKTYFININISLPLSFDQRVSWAVHHKSLELAKQLDEWAKEASLPTYKNITKRYFEQSKQESEELELSKNRPAGTISNYDDIFKSCAKGTKYDWYLLAAISYQESRFRNNLTSWAGASGIMGLMPRTASSLGLSNEDRMNPTLSVKAAIKLLNRLDRLYKDIEDSNERLKFVLAAYNGGQGHINDGQRLAEKYGANPYLWNDVKVYVGLKNKPKYYTDPVCKNGYFRATQTIRYVYDVTTNTERFKKIEEEHKQALNENI